MVQDRSAGRDAKSPRQRPGRASPSGPEATGEKRRCRGPSPPSSTEALMVAPIPPYLSPERLEQLADASRQRQAALYPSPKPPQRRRRLRQYPGGRPNPWRTARLRRCRYG